MDFGVKSAEPTKNLLKGKLSQSNPKPLKVLFKHPPNAALMPGRPINALTKRFFAFFVVQNWFDMAAHSHSPLQLRFSYNQETPSPGINRSNRLPVGCRFFCQATEGSKNNYSHQSAFDIRHLWHPKDQIVHAGPVLCDWTCISDSQLFQRPLGKWDEKSLS